MENVYLGCQPILDLDGNLVAYEILYGDSAKESYISNDRFASASVISSILNQIKFLLEADDEKEVLAILKDDTFSSQNEFAKKFNL